MQAAGITGTYSTSHPNHWDIRSGVSAQESNNKRGKGKGGGFIKAMMMIHMMFLSLWSWIACPRSPSSCIFPPVRVRAPLSGAGTQKPYVVRGSWLLFRGKFDMSYRLSQTKRPCLFLSLLLIFLTLDYHTYPNRFSRLVISLTLVSGVHESQSNPPGVCLSQRK